MKKFITYSFALLLLGGVYAQSGINSQNVSIGIQNGTNTGIINQSSFSVLVNYSDLNQLGSNLAQVDQIGANDSYINQTGNNNALVVQDGGDGFYTPSAAYQISHIDQMGFNSALVRQTGDGNTSDIDQTNNVAGFRNRAAVRQGQNVSNSSNNSSSIMQLNDANFSRVDQDGNNNVAQTRQTSNVAVIPVHASMFLQGTFINQSGETNFADVEQNGGNQLSRIYQTTINGSSANPFTNEAYVLQNGELNQSFLTQTGTGIIPANNTATVTQTNMVGGPGNISTLTQSGANTATVNQTNF